MENNEIGGKDVETSNEYRFTVTGGFLIDKTLKTERSFDGTPIGFTLPDGRTVRLAVALEVELDGGADYRYVTSETEMSELGFTCLDYDQTDFAPVGVEENDDNES
jgi:hypothetical protein